MISKILSSVCDNFFLSVKDFSESTDVRYPCAIYDEQSRTFDASNPFFVKIRARVFFCFLPRNKEEEAAKCAEAVERLKAFAEALPLPASQFTAEFFFSNYADLVCGASAELEFNLPKKPCNL